MSMRSPEPGLALPATSERGKSSRRSAVIAGLICMLAGVLVSITPHFAWWPTLGEPVYIADHDDTFYLAFTSQAFFQHPLKITDPILKSGGSSQFPWAQLVPPVVIAKVFGLRPVDVLLIWRIWGGLSIGLTCYLLALVIVKRPWIAAAVAVLFFSDAGVLIARPIVKHVGLIAKTCVRGLTLEEIGQRPNVMQHWRLITPSVSLAFLLAHCALMGRAREMPSRSNIAWAGMSFGLLFYVYFYFWTAATVALGLLWLLDAGHRRVPLVVGVIGLILGSPTLLVNAQFKRLHPSDWLHRLDMFLPISRNSEWLIPLGTIAILAVAVPWAIVRRRDVLYVACIAVGGLLMVNHQIVTGLQIQNFHWAYVWGPFTWLLIVFELLPLARRIPLSPRTGAILATAGLLAFYGFGIYFRVAESTRSADSLLVQSTYASYRDQKRGPGWPSFVANEVVAGTPAFLEMAPILDDLRPLDHYALLASPTTLEAECEDRVVLNAALQGMPRETFLTRQTKALRDGWGPWLRDPTRREEKLTRLMALWDHLPSTLPRQLTQFQVRYLGLVAGTANNHLGARWKRLQAGPNWDIYEYLDYTDLRSPGR